MKKINLLLSATVILASANGFSMESPAKEYAKVGIKTTKFDVSTPAKVIATERNTFYKTYGITPQELVRILNVRADLRNKYADFAIKKMDRFKDIKNEVEKRSKIAGKLIRKYVKTGDIYVGLKKEADKKELYKNYKKEVLDFIKNSKGSKIEINRTFVRFPTRYNYTGKKNKDNSKKVVAVKKETITIKPATKPLAKPVIQPRPVRPITPARKPVIVKETEIDIWTVEPLKKPMVKEISRPLPASKLALNDNMPMPRPMPRPDRPMPRPENMLVREDDDTYQADENFPRPLPRPMPEHDSMMAQDGEDANASQDEPSANMVADDVENPEWDNMYAQDLEDANASENGQEEGKEPDTQ